MKTLKCISLFFLYPCIMLCAGIYIGVSAERYFYPGREDREILKTEEDKPSDDKSKETILSTAVEKEEVLTADTEYVLEEYDVKRGTKAETVLKVPDKYLGMDRTAFYETMELYEASPPLAELERGFVGLEVRSFSAERVVVRMSYEYTEPTDSFYIRVENNMLVVYCEDKEKVYLYTEISALSLPEEMQSRVAEGLFIQNEAELFHLLETYSS